jgi:GNAT superfamily N-acetyltransferase
MPLVIRPARLADAFDIATVHHGAVHAIAPQYYGPDVLDQWAPPVSLDRCERLYRDAQDSGTIQLVAELDGAIVGFANFRPAGNEIAACYVAPGLTGRGIGAQLLAELETLARRAGCTYLKLRASLNAKGFYRAHLYLETGRGEHRFANGGYMAAVHMRKSLA